MDFLPHINSLKTNQQPWFYNIGWKVERWPSIREYRKEIRWVESFLEKAFLCEVVYLQSTVNVPVLEQHWSLQKMASRNTRYQTNVASTNFVPTVLFNVTNTSRILPTKSRDEVSLGFQ